MEDLENLRQLCLKAPARLSPTPGKKLKTSRVRRPLRQDEAEESAVAALLPLGLPRYLRAHRS